MANTHINRLRCVVSNTPGTSGDLVVGAAPAGRRGFTAAEDGLTFEVVIADGNAWEVRTGCVYTHSTTTLTRGTFGDSSTGSAIDLTSAAVVSLGPTAKTMTDLEPSRAWSAPTIALLQSGQPMQVPYPLPNWRKALANAMAGVADARVSFIGDSTTAGLLALATGAWSKSPSVLVAKMLAARGIPVNANSVWSDSTRGGAATMATFDPRVAFGANWSTTASGGFSSVGGGALLNSAGSGTLSFTPTDPTTGAAYQFDTIDVYFTQNTGYGSFTIGVDGGAAIGATVAAAGSRQLQVASRTTSLGAHTVNINATVAGTIYILGIVCSNSAQKAVRIFNHGAGSYASSDYSMGTVGDFTTLAAITNNTLAAPLAPHLAIVDIGINDRRLANYSSTFDTALQSCITRLVAVGSDVLLCKPVPSQLTFNSPYTLQANQDAFDAAIDAIAAANNVMVINKRARLQTYEIANPLGFYSDGLHLSAAGYAAQALDLVDYMTM